MDDASREYWLKRQLKSVTNDDTLCPPPYALSPLRHGAGELFFEFYDRIREWIHTRKGAGLAVIALDEQGLQAKTFLPSRPNRVSTAVVGRHEKVDIYLGGDPSMSLRHLAVLVSPSTPKRASRFRVIDLRTPYGFADERGAALRACEADGPFFARLGRYSLMFLPRDGSRARWPDEPEVLWAKLRGEVSVASLPHPATLDDRLIEADEEALGELVITSAHGVGTMAVGRRAARTGILLGRSDRCDGDVLLSDPHISRVHVLIVEMAGSLYAIDTASKNGMWGRGGDDRARLLETGTTFTLCGLATVEWRFFH